MIRLTSTQEDHYAWLLMEDSLSYKACNQPGEEGLGLGTVTHTGEEI